jgi:PPK2 family polyphosphate:nucleotide phosphotransferase
VNYRKLFRVKPGSRLKLGKLDPGSTDDHMTERSAERLVGKLGLELSRLQYTMYSEGKRSLLICLQGLDGAGKDGTISHVLASMNPMGAHAHAFKVPSREEASHDFLWRVEKAVPARGEVAIFNRSHYEDVLVTRVHNLVPKPVWKARYGFIRDFEERLVASGTTILKFYLHISPDEQLRRFKQRLEDPARQWKISESDYTEREFWGDYLEAYEDAIARTSTEDAPWYVIPSNKKWFRNLAVARIVVDTMKSLDMQMPAPAVDLRRIARQYHQAERRAGPTVSASRSRRR